MVYQCGLRLAERLKSGGPSLGRSPDAHKQRRLVNQDQIQIFEVNRVDTIFEQGFVPCSFFVDHRLHSENRACRSCASANPIERSFEIAAERCEDLTPLVYRRLLRRTSGNADDVPHRGQRTRQGLDAGADDRGDPGFRRLPHRPFPHDRMRNFLARRLWHAARSVHRVLRRDRRERCANPWGRTGRRRSTRRGENCSARSRLSVARSDA